jgi:phosphosulfolactate synthase
LAGFLDLPERSSKPRERGLTHVLDKGLSTAEAEGLLEVCGPSVDLVKLGWGTAVVTANLIPKLEAYTRAGVPVVLGGTLTEIALRDNRIDGLVAWLRELGIRHVEISDGTLPIAHSEKVDLIRRLAAEFTVLSEVGSKDADMIMAPYRWVEQIETELEAGAWKVITESRETGSAGIYRADGEIRMGLIDEIAHAVERPLSRTCVSPRSRGLLHRSGRSRKPANGGYCDWSAPTVTTTNASCPATTAVLWSIGLTASVPTWMSFATTRASATWPGW